jgi:hypothetical protein
MKLIGYNWLIYENLPLVPHLLLVLLSGHFPLGFPTKILHAFLFSLGHATFSSNFVLDLIILIACGDEYNL